MKKATITILTVLALISCNSKAPADNAQEEGTVIQNEAAKPEVEESSEKADESNTASYKGLRSQLCQTLQVKEGNSLIEKFAKAIEPITGELVTSDEYEGTKTLDTKNGYFTFYQEGAGSIRYDMAYWNRKDGKKMFIVSYRAIDEVYAETAEEKNALTMFNEDQWNYIECSFSDDSQFGMRYDMGFVAYIYDEASKQLKPMEECPINGIAPGPNFYELPQQGKDIKVCRGTNGEYEYTTVRFDGIQFYH
ncbi:MAG: hypothetical protein KBT29_02980 [Prevotellaceae bacterium]|nr:hypothetical protein [Candidatus Minthosoma caballi]